MSSKIILIGKGHLGSILARQDLGVGMDNIIHWKEDIAKLDNRTIYDINPSFVINAAGKTDLPWCEANKEECWRCNVIEPVMLQRRLPASSVLIHLSSGCVWTGPFRPDGQPFCPMDHPTPACFYAWTKVASDSQLTIEAKVDSRRLFILRPRQVYSSSPSPRNTLSKLLSYDKLIDTPNSMTSSDLITRVIKHFIYVGLYGAPTQQIVNVYDRGISSPFMVGNLLAGAGLRKRPEKMEKSELDTWHKPRRVDVVMYDSYLESLHGITRRVEDELRDAIKEYAKNRRVRDLPPLKGMTSGGRE